MSRAEVVQRAHQVHPPLDGRAPACRPSGATPQHRQATPERPVQPLDVRGVEHLTAWGTPEQGQEQARAALHQAMYGARDHPTGVLLHDLRDGEIRPRHQTRATASGSWLTRPEGRAHDVDVRTQAITDEQQRSPLGARRHDRHQTGDQITIPMGAHRTTEPKPGADHYGHRHPEHPRLRLDMDLIGLHLAQITLLYDLVVMDGLGVCAPRLNPCPHRWCLEAKRGFNGWDGTAMPNQRHHQGDQRRTRPAPEEGRACPRTERLPTDGTAIALALLTMDRDIAFAHLASCGTVHGGAECLQRIDGTPPFGVKHRKYAPIRSFFKS